MSTTIKPQDQLHREYVDEQAKRAQREVESRLRNLVFLPDDTRPAESDQTVDGHRMWTSANLAAAQEAWDASRKAFAAFDVQTRHLREGNRRRLSKLRFVPAWLWMLRWNLPQPGCRPQTNGADNLRVTSERLRHDTINH